MFEDIKKILSYGVWAPSGDNCQPWRFGVKDNVLRIYNLPGKIPFYNFEEKGSYLAHGALIENINIAARDLGYKSNISLFPNPSNKDLVAEIVFEKTERVPQELLDVIKTRCTNRKPYKKEPLSAEQISALENSVKDIPGVQNVNVTDRQNKKIIGRASAENEAIVLNTERYHQLFFKHIVWTEEEEKQKKSGLYFKTMELPGPKGFLFKFVSDWNHMKLMKKIGFPKLIVAGNAESYASAGAMSAIVTKNNTPADFVNTGRATQRVWLTATKMGLAAHPISGILFLMQRVLVKQTEDLTAEQIQMIKNAYQEISDAFGKPDGYVTFILRIGKAPAPTANCSRLEPVIEIEN